MIEANLPVHTQARASTVHLARALVVLLALLSPAWAAPPLPPTTPITLNFVGDVMLARGVAGAARSRAKPADWAGVLADLNPALERADLTVGNLESPLTTAPFTGKSYDLRAPLEAVRALSPFDALSIVNNHMLDGGAPGLIQTRATLDRAGIRALEGRLWTRTVRGVRLGFLALLDEGISPTLEPSWNARLSQVREAASQVDLLTVLMHWGAEYSAVTVRQRTLAAALERSGARLIVGSGPHVLQPVERVGRATVAYSLGNFVFDQAMPSTRMGAILHVSLHVSAQMGALELSATPTRIRSGRVELARDEVARQVLERLRVPLWLPSKTPPARVGLKVAQPTFPLRPSTCPRMTLPRRWDVRSSTWGDVTGDGVPECVLTVWRPWRGWRVERWGPKRPSPVAKNRDARGDSAHILLLRPLEGGTYDEIWAGSPLAIPVLFHTLEDVDGDGRLELIALEGSYAAGRAGKALYRAVWAYKGFGFELRSRVRLNPP